MPRSITGACSNIPSTKYGRYSLRQVLYVQRVGRGAQERRHQLREVVRRDRQVLRLDEPEGAEHRRDAARAQDVGL